MYIRSASSPSTVMWAFHTKQPSSLSLNNNKVYALPIVGLHALPNSFRILTASLQAHISRRSVYLHIV